MPQLSEVVSPSLDDLDGRRVAYFTTAPEQVHARLREHLEVRYGARVELVSGNLARRDDLRRDLDAAGGVDAYVVELKAAAIDVVADPAGSSLRV